MSQSKRGIVNFIKPPGMSSFSAVGCIKNMLAGEKAGHSGTLDPLAAGVLVICLGRGTKMIPYLPEEEKEYIAEIRLGVVTDTLDREGEVLKKNKQWRQITYQRVKNVISSFRGEIKQIPPMYSAVHHNGKRLYELAREGKTVKREPRLVEVHDIAILRVDLPILQLKISCSPGTYIRSLARDIGDELGPGAHLSFLVRTCSGPFNIKQAWTREEIREGLKNNEDYFLQKIDTPLSLPQLFVTEKARKKAIHGATLKPVDIQSQLNMLKLKNRYRVYTPQGEFISISELRKSDKGELELKPLRVFFEFDD